MHSTSIKKLHPLSLLTRLSVAEKQPVQTWGYGQYSWSKFLAFNPVDTYCSSEYAPHAMKDFIRKNQGKFIFGYLSYELGYPLQMLKSRQMDPSIPLIYLNAYENFVEFKQRETVLHYIDEQFPILCNEILKRDLIDNNPQPEINLDVKIKKEEYFQKFNKIIDYIKAGDIYQINFTHHLNGSTNLLSSELFSALTKTNRVTHAAFMDLGEFSISSLSPERFIKIADRTIITQPIKGTRPRGRTAQEDSVNLKELLSSPKEQAELFMIIDLLRNDLGKVCNIGSVKVEKERAIQRLSKVFHTYGRITGYLLEAKDGVDALLSMFPGGSITGCPKRRAMEIIHELEDYARDLYTGSMGYILPDGNLEFNIAIRTIIQKRSEISLGIGGGITIKSNAEDEYQESLIKAASFKM